MILNIVLKNYIKIQPVRKIGFIIYHYFLNCFFINQTVIKYLLSRLSSSLQVLNNIRHMTVVRKSQLVNKQIVFIFEP